MKILTVTTQKAYNYGAVLQAYALQRTLLSLGYENEILDHEFVSDGKAPRRSAKVWLRDTILATLARFHAKEIKQFERNFKEFQTNCLNMTRTYHSLKEVFQAPPQADCYLTGSDQVFALGNELVPMRFLAFGPPEIPRVSYAASLGSYAMSERQLSFIDERLRLFQKVSMREKKGSDYLKQSIGVETMTHVDPVFLLDRSQWSELMGQGSRMKGDYILCFPLQGNKTTQKVVDRLKKQTGLPVVCVQTKSYKSVRADRYIFDASVGEFLHLIKHARAVVTTSFHGTALSILFHRPFFAMTGAYKPERQQSVCELFGLQHRVVKEGDTSFPDLEMSFDGVDDVITRERNRSLEYLTSLGQL